MPCFKPLTAFKPLEGGPLIFHDRKNHREIQIPCGQCIGCRLERSRQWALRCIHEASLHSQNCFLTLTYDEEHLPANGSLYKPDLQRFFKRLRKRKGKFRYYACGEYGDTTKRAHYHGCIFGLDFEDKIPFRKSGEHTLYISEELNDIWGNGNSSIGELNFETAAYTARYVMKKGFGKMANKFQTLDETTGELTAIVQPYATMSLRAAIGKEWLEKYASDIYGADKDYIVVKGRKMKPAKYYDKLYDKINNDHMEHIKRRRQDTEKPTEEILRAREKHAHAKSRGKQNI